MLRSTAKAEQVVILEKDTEVCEDPRGIVVNGDAVRISYQIGIGEGLTTRIGKGGSLTPVSHPVCLLELTGLDLLQT